MNLSINLGISLYANNRLTSRSRILFKLENKKVRVFFLFWPLGSLRHFKPNYKSWPLLKGYIYMRLWIRFKRFKINSKALFNVKKFNFYTRSMHISQNGRRFNISKKATYYVQPILLSIFHWKVKTNEKISEIFSSLGTFSITEEFFEFLKLDKNSYF